MVNIIFMGPPGSGKGTQSIMLSKELKIPTISTGEVLRKEVKMQSEVGIKAKNYINCGQLVPDEMVVNIIRNRIIHQDCENGFIVDGFPRNINQAIVFDEMINSLNKTIDIVLDFKIEDKVLVKRISGRFSCSKCEAIYNSHFKKTQKEGVCDICESSEFVSRPDDNKRSVEKRLQVYHDTADELIDYYKRKNLLSSINALQKPTSISEKLIEIVREFSKKIIINNLK